MLTMLTIFMILENYKLAKYKLLNCFHTVIINIQYVACLGFSFFTDKSALQILPTGMHRHLFFFPELPGIEKIFCAK